MMNNVEQAKWDEMAMAYLRHLCDACRGCLKTYNCPNCLIGTAKNLVRMKEEIGMRQVGRPKDPVEVRQKEILNILRKADRPLRAREIRLQSTASRNVKWWTLKRMVGKGLICKCRVKNFYGRQEVAYYTKGKKP